MWNVWHLQLQDTALAALNGVPPFPLPHNADAISAHSFCRLALSVRYLPCPRHTYGSDFFIALHSEQEIYFHQLPPFDLTPKGRADLSPKGTRRLTFSAALATADRCTSVRASIRSAPGAGDCGFSLTYTPTRHRTRYIPSVSLRRPVCEPLTLSRKLLPTSRSDTSLCSNFSCAVCSIRSPLRA